MQKIVPFLWFDGKAEEAANFYVSVFKNSKVVRVTRYGVRRKPRSTSCGSGSPQADPKTGAAGSQTSTACRGKSFLLLWGRC